MKKHLHADVIAGAVMIVFALIWGKMALGFPEIPRRFPLFVSFAFILIGILVLIGGIRKMNAAGEEAVSPIQWEKFRYVLAGFAIIVGYAVLMGTIHFFPATLIFVPVMMLFLRIRNPIQIVVTDLVLNGFLYWMFIIMLKIQLP